MPSILDVVTSLPWSSASNTGIVADYPQQADVLACHAEPPKPAEMQPWLLLLEQLWQQGAREKQEDFHQRFSLLQPYPSLVCCFAFYFCVSGFRPWRPKMMRRKKIPAIFFILLRQPKCVLKMHSKKRPVSTKTNHGVTQRSLHLRERSGPCVD